jgi:CRISPR system Cascade subunit CasE
MYLSRLMLNPRSRQVRTDLADRYELHRTLLNAFPETLPVQERVLYRVEEGTLEPIVRVLVQSQGKPDWTIVPRLRDRYLLHEPELRKVDLDVFEGQRLRFRLQANPTVKRAGKRHALYADDDLLAWLQRKGDQHGFEVGPLDVRTVKLGKKHGKGRQQVWHAVQFDGVLTVTHASIFSEALTQGIGSAKAFGFGLLSIPYTE